MLKKVIEIIKSISIFCLSLTALPFIQFLFYKPTDTNNQTNIDDIIIIAVCILSLISILITFFISTYLNHKEISSGPLNDESGKNINKLLKRFAKFLKKYSKCMEKYDEFEIKIPEFNFSSNNKRFVYKNKTINSKNKNLSTIEICNKIMSLKRILLEINKSSLRIKFGQFVIKNSADINQKIECYIDFLGWTKLLNGNSDGIKDINEGISLCRKQIKIVNNAGSINEYKFKMIRAYRHLGTTYYTYKLDKNNIPLYIDAAFDYLSELSNLSSDEKKQYTRLAVGLKYNKILFDYYEYIYHTKSITDLNKIKNNIDNLYNCIHTKNKIDLYTAINEKKLNKNYMDINYIDNHRKIKICSLYAILFGNPSSKQSLKEVENILDSNIYIDEAIELYIYSKLK